MKIRMDGISCPKTNGPGDFCLIHTNRTAVWIGKRQFPIFRILVKFVSMSSCGAPARPRRFKKTPTKYTMDVNLDTPPEEEEGEDAAQEEPDDDVVRASSLPL